VSTRRTIQQRTAHASVAGLVSTAASIVLQIATVPFVLTFWGAERYGLWLAVMAVVMTVRSIEGGYITFVGNQFNVLYHESRDRLQRTLGASIAMCAGLGAVQILVSAALLASGSDSILWGAGKGHLDGDNAGVALIVLVVAWALAGNFPALLNRLLVPAGMLSHAIWWSLAYQATLFAVVMLAAWLGASIQRAAAAYAAAQALIYLTSAGYIRRKLPEFYPWWHGGRLSTGLQDLSRSIVLTVNSGVQQAGVSGALLVVSSFLGPAMVAAFGTARTLANFGTALGGVFANALAPELVRYFVTAQHEKLLLAFRATALSSGLAVNVSLLALIACAEPVYAIWTNGRLSLDLPVFLGLAAAVSAWSAGWPFCNFLAVINSLRAQLMLTLIRTGAALGVGVAYVDAFGLAAVALGIGLGELAASLLASFVIVPRLIASREGHVPRLVQAEGLFLSLPVLGICLYGMFAGDLPGALTLAAAAVVLLLGWRAWRRLPQDARERAASIIRRKQLEQS